MAEVESLKDSSGGTANSSAQLGQGAPNIRSTSLTSQKIDIPYRGPVVVPDSRTNSLIVIGTPEHLALAESLINQLDRRLPQVTIDVEVIELTERGIKELGTGFSGQSGKVQFGFEANGTNPGFSVSSDSSLPVASSFRLKLGALINDKLAKLLANPRITATDNTEAQLEIVDEVIKGTKISNQVMGTGTQNLVVVEPIFGVAGIILNILPKVGEDGFVTLRLHPTVSNIRETMKDSLNNQITLLSRRDLVSQQVRVKNGSTLAIGGITQENLIRNKTKVPLLGDIPLLGSIFSWESSEKNKTELVILLTPRILDDQASPVLKKPF
ncbi:MAG TPA: hypothetical protein DD435_07210 [Cyanobacteria bacterium UBA8530]|nr:hypothetical protein [Cyanobacteria bacterium UBA8530]